MTYKNYKNEVEGITRYSCGLLFACFTFCYLYCIEGEVLAQAQHVFSNGLTSYSMPVGAGVITGVLMLMQWVVRLLSHLPQRFYALTYLPSAVALIVLIDIAESADGKEIAGWMWIIPLVVAVYIGLCYLANKLEAFLWKESEDFVRQLYPNYIILLATAIVIGSTSTTNDVRYFELKTERLIVEGEYADACEVGDRSFRTSQRLTQLRMYALSKQGCLAERLFDYPQWYGSDGLINIADTDTVNRTNAIDIERHLKVICGKNINSSFHYLRLAAGIDSVRNQIAADYYLCALLLDKRTKIFLKELPRIYNLSDTIPYAYDALPRAYKEALLIMGNEEHALQGVIMVEGDTLGTLTDTTIVGSYRDYQAMKTELSNEREKINKTHRAFGHTFWWYYDFSDKGNGELMKK